MFNGVTNVWYRWYPAASPKTERTALGLHPESQVNSLTENKITPVKYYDAFCVLIFGESVDQNSFSNTTVGIVSLA